MGENSAPWPSIENFSLAYAEHIATRHRAHATAATVIQRAWLGKAWPDADERQKALRFMRSCMSHDLLERDVWAHEKLDGTNFGVTCAGVRLGRRTVVTAATYQRVAVDGAAPTQAQVVAVKTALADAAGIPLAALPEFCLYGELMCNPNKFDYRTRYQGVRFAAFGGKFRAVEAEEDDAVATGARLSAALRNAGIANICDIQRGRVTIVASPAYTKLVKACGVETVPLVGQGTLRDVLVDLKPLLMKNGSEGIVLTGMDGFLRKWKTGQEDDSKGDMLLQNIIADLDDEYRCTVRDEQREALRLLYDVASNKGAKVGKTARAPKDKTAGRLEAVLDMGAFKQALASAESKYDALEAYFAATPPKTGWIKDRLAAEVKEDMMPQTEAEEKALFKAVGAHVSAAFKAWRAARTE